MKRRRLTNREFDELGRRLVIAAKPGDGEIDRLVSGPGLYDGVLAKIAAADKPAPPVTKARLSWKPVAAMAMTVALLSIPLLAYLKYAGVGDPVVSKPRVLPREVKEKPVTVEEPQPFKGDVVSMPPTGANERPQPERAVLTRQEPETPTPLPRRNVRRTPAEPHSQPEPVFHPIGPPEKAEDAAIDGRIVRVEVPRSALFAMGVDVPLENGTRPIKADLLLGSDGSPRAIRLVE